MDDSRACEAVIADESSDVEVVEDASEVIDEVIPVSSVAPPPEPTSLTEEVGVDGVEMEEVACPVLMSSTNDCNCRFNVRISGESEIAQEPKEDPTIGTGAADEADVDDEAVSESTKKFLGVQRCACFGDCG